MTWTDGHNDCWMLGWLKSMPVDRRKYFAKKYQIKKRLKLDVSKVALKRIMKEEK